MKNGTKLLSLTLAVALLLTLLTGCANDYNGAADYEIIKPPVITPDANGNLTFGDQTFSVDTEQLALNLNLQSNEILDLSPLAWCTQLRYLSVNLTVTPYIFRDKVNKKHVAEMTPTDLTPLAQLKNLEHLELNVGKFENFSAISSLTELESLVLWIDGAVDLTPLTACGWLNYLAIGGRGTVDLTPLSKCGALTSLRVDVYDSDWTTPDLSALSGAPSLEVLQTGASNGLSQLVNVPLWKLVDLNDSADILKNLPLLSTLECLEFSDERLNDVQPLLNHPGVRQITLEVGAQEIDGPVEILSADDPLLAALNTTIPVTQLKSFLMQGGRTITIVVDRNRTAGELKEK